MSSDVQALRAALQTAAILRTESVVLDAPAARSLLERLSLPVPVTNPPEDDAGWGDEQRRAVLVLRACRIFSTGCSNTTLLGTHHPADCEECAEAFLREVRRVLRPGDQERE